MRPNKKALFIILVILAFLATVHFLGRDSSNPKQQPTAVVAGSGVTTKPSFDKQQYPLSQASSLWVVVNKGRQLPKTYVPANLTVPNVSLRLSSGSPEMEVRSDTAQAMQEMFAGAAVQGIKLMLASGYRSYTEQVSLYDGYVASDGKAAADASSAHPGFSEHQTGLAADLEPANRVCEVAQCFDATPEGKWLVANAYKYGFIIRYPKDKEDLTGYEYEPWHVRYVGKDLAAQINQTGQTLERFFGLPNYVDYSATPFQLRSD